MILLVTETSLLSMTWISSELERQKQGPFQVIIR